ncbi:inositol monophosphatase family protein [Actinacidiphila acididurans]|uniref:inositol-phosphate phosphatase n=1 Tax=Actinacidiphila acididurans TaxID=2784346 RepID=A0ABS2TUM0_9ACTN|nr:inositol monophosphatase family protein [Actinacidiphila acididurans]MBM9507033.1 inositol monophosphatase [Actinacidiphila acididurans]
MGYEVAGANSGRAYTGGAAPGVGDDLLAAVEDTVRAVVAAEVMPRWRALTDRDIAHKSGPHDLVTTADRRAEDVLTERLTALLPGSVVVGEEAVSADPARLGLLHGPDPVWVVDPIDGTASFVRGEDDFSTLVTLVQHGSPLASWTYGPRLGLFATARLGDGARMDGRPMRTRTTAEPLRIWTSNPVFRHPRGRVLLDRMAAAGVEATPLRASAGLAYLDVARGRSDGVLFFWEAPWDHAAGLLLVTEAGGASLTAAGRPFDVAGGNTLPFTVARDEDTVRRVIGLLADPDSGTGPRTGTGPDDTGRDDGPAAPGTKADGR